MIPDLWIVFSLVNYLKGEGKPTPLKWCENLKVKMRLGQTEQGTIHCLQGGWSLSTQ